VFAIYALADCTVKATAYCMRLLQFNAEGTTSR